MADNVHPALSNPEDWEEAAAQAPVALAAMGFLKAAVQDKDLIAAWGAMDPRLQVAWAAAWIEANSSSLVQAGHDLDDALTALSNGQSGHELWQHFSRVALRELASIVPSRP